VVLAVDAVVLELDVESLLGAAVVLAAGFRLSPLLEPERLSVR
jgi:hypothetical protein